MEHPNPHYEECSTRQRNLYAIWCNWLSGLCFGLCFMFFYFHASAEKGSDWADSYAIILTFFFGLGMVCMERATSLVNSRRAQIATVERGRRDDGINGVPPATKVVPFRK